MPQPLVTGGWPRDDVPEAFVGDVLVYTLEGEHLAAVTGARVGPAAKGISVTLGDPLGRSPTPPQATDNALTITITIDYTTYPGEKRLELLSPDGPSNAFFLLVMM